MTAPTSPPTPDADAVRALAWLKRGQPDADIIYDEICPKLTEAKLAEFVPASYQKVTPP